MPVSKRFPNRLPVATLRVDGQCRSRMTAEGVDLVGAFFSRSPSFSNGIFPSCFSTIRKNRPERFFVSVSVTRRARIKDDTRKIAAFGNLMLTCTIPTRRRFPNAIIFLPRSRVEKIYRSRMTAEGMTAEGGRFGGRVFYARFFMRVNESYY